MFEGFTQDCSDFLMELAFNNERPWFMANKERFERSLNRPFKALAEETAALMNEAYPQMDFRLKITRIYRDARRLFGRGPYKDHLWFSFKSELSGDEALGFFFEIGAAEYTYGMGTWCASAEQMAAFRGSIDANPAGFERLVSPLSEYKNFGDFYKKPKADKGELINRWYNRKGVGVERTRDFGGELLTAEFPKYLAAEFKKLMPMYEYLVSVFNAVEKAEGSHEQH